MKLFEQVMIERQKHHRDNGGGIAREFGAAPFVETAAQPVDESAEVQPMDDPETEEGIEAATATVVPEVVKDEPKGNRFSRFFGHVTFEAEDKRKPYMFPEGLPVAQQTAQTGLAQVHFPACFGIPGFACETTRIVQRVAPGGKLTIGLVMPSVSLGKGAPKKNIFNLKAADKTTIDEYTAWQVEVVNAFYLWRKAQIAGGYVDRTASTIASNQRELTPDEMVALGLTLPEPATT